MSSRRQTVAQRTALPLYERPLHVMGQCFTSNRSFITYVLPISDEVARAAEAQRLADDARDEESDFAADLARYDRRRAEAEAAAGPDRFAQLKAACECFGQGLQVYVDEDGAVFVADNEAGFEERFLPVRDPEALASVAAMCVEDSDIERARALHIEQLAKGDAVLAEVLAMHIAFNDGGVDSDPTVVDDVAFYQVGRNASHEFYAGAKDGKRFTMSCGDACMDADEFEQLEDAAQRRILNRLSSDTFSGDRELPAWYLADGSDDATKVRELIAYVRAQDRCIAFYDKHVREVEQWGYLGHF